EVLYGERRAGMEDAIAYEELVQTIKDLAADGHPGDSALHLKLAGRDPNEGTSDVAYQKGRWFLGFLEERFGRKAFDAFLREYFDAHAFKSIDTATFRAWLLDYLERPEAPAVSAAEIDAWLYEPGLPPTMPKVAQGVFASVDDAAVGWRAGRIATDALPVKDWIPQEWVRFLDEQPADLEDGQLADLRSTFRLGADGNAEIALSWFELVVRTGYEPAYGDLERFLLQTGRWRLVETLFRELSRTEEGRALGKRIYSKAKPGYHRSIRDAVERLLFPDAGNAVAQ
ncbi:MAG TPA: leukotriene A4 hydrolase C-terminal domain-containing protein, partial [Steroidobacteraceae bacterium]|nr:leukotriene A4 hydrolase C-terminal domain-containing protein [Steroidobacteraceae bacterium]